MIGRVVFAGVVVVAEFLTIGNSAREIDVAAISGSHGEIRSGEQFGIRIGSSRESAVKQLESLGFRVLGVPLPKNWKCIDLKDGEDEDIMSDSSWRGGVICLAHRGGMISAMSWNFSPFANFFP